MAAFESARVVDLSGAGSAPARQLRVVWVAVEVFAWWSAVAVAMAALVSAQKSIPLRYTLPSEALNYYTLGAASIVVWFVSARLAARWRGWPVWWATQVALGVVLVSAWQTIYGAYLRSVVGPRVWASIARESGLFQLFYACVLYFAVVVTVLTIQSARRARENERRRHELALLARDAELRALTAQIEPHFLLNTLNSVLALIDASPADARAMLERLAELLKAAFDESQEQEVTLGRELDLISAYLHIEQVRFAERLTVTTDVPDALRGISLPPFLLQPLVENAIKHVVSPSTRPTTIAIRGRRDGRLVRLEVADSGDGFDRDAAPSSSGHGLSLTERRLRTFAPDGALHVERRIGGCVVSLSFPA